MTKKTCVFLTLLAPLCGPAQTVSVARLLHKTPSKAVDSFKRGARFYAAGSLQQGAAELERAVALDPGFPEAHCNLGVIYMVRNRPQDAANEFRQAAELDPGVAAYHCNLGVALAAMERLDEARAEARTAIALDSAYVKAHFLLGVILASVPGTRGWAGPYLAYAARWMPEARAALERMRGEENGLPGAEP